MKESLNIDGVADRTRDPRSRWGEVRSKNHPSADTLAYGCRKHGDSNNLPINLVSLALGSLPVCGGGVVGSASDVRYGGLGDGGPVEYLP